MIRNGPDSTSIEIPFLKYRRHRQRNQYYKSDTLPKYNIKEKQIIQIWVKFHHEKYNPIFPFKFPGYADA